MTKKETKILNEQELYDAIGMQEREREFKQFLYALLTKEHLLLNGPAGTGKSYFAKNVFALINGQSKLFSIHLTKFMSEELLFGPIDIKKLREESTIEYNTKNSALEANFLYLDEFFDASDVLLRSMLEVLNEREWRRGNQFIKCPLHSAVVTSNYTRENEVTAAVLDRFIFKAEIKPLKTDNGFSAMLRNSDFTPAPMLTLQEIEKISNDVIGDTITISDKVMGFYLLLKKEYEKNTKKYISDRTAKKALKLLKASAILNGRDEVSLADLGELFYVFCTLNNDVEENMFQTAFEKVVGKEQAEKEIVESLKKINEVVDNFPKNLDKLSEKEFIENMGVLNQHLGLLSNIASPTKKVDAEKTKLIEKVKKLIYENRKKFMVNSGDNTTPAITTGDVDDANTGTKYNPYF
jgi:MoxR-like ATPase